VSSYADVIARGGGELHYIAELEGIGPVLGTSVDYPADSWYSTGGHSYMQGLRPGTIARSCAGRPGEVWPDLRSFTMEVDDPAGTLAAVLKDLDGCNNTELTASIDDDDTTINVASTAAFASTGVIYIEREAIAYTGKTATSFTGCTRGHYGSEAVEHIYSIGVFPACIPVVSDGPGGLRGRRVVIYAAEHTQAGTSAATRIWIGYVKGDEWSEAGRISIPVAHVLDGFIAGQVMGAVPQAQLHGLYVPNSDGNRWGRIVVSDETGSKTVDLVGDDAAPVFYASSAELVAAFIAKFNADASPWEAGILPTGQVFLLDLHTPSVETTCRIEVSGGLLPAILGFAVSGDADIGGYCGTRMIADRTPANVFAITAPVGEAFEPRLYIGEGQAAFFVESYCRVVDSAGGERTLAITDIDTSDDYLTVSSSLSGFPLSVSDDALMQFGGGALPVVLQVWGDSDLWIDDLVRLLWAGETYGSTLPYSLPDRWLPEPALRDGDVDWTGLRELCSGMPAMAGKVFLNVREPTAARELVTGNLMACGIYAVVLEDGGVAWRRVELPTEVGITETVSASMIDGQRCIGLQTERNRDRVTNLYRFDVSNAHLRLLEETTGMSVHGVPEGAAVIVTDQASLGRYGARAARLAINALGEVTETIKLAAPPSVFIGVGPASEALGRHMAGTLHYLGRPRPHVRVPVTLKGRAFDIGDAVYLTSVWVLDTLTGSQGVTAKVCVVLGWDRQEGFGSGDIDWLDLLIVDSPAGAIAPAALADVFDGDTELGFSSIDLYHGDDGSTDLSWFDVGDHVQIIQWDDETPDTATATVTAVSTTGKTMDLSSIVGTITVPAIVRFGVYSSCSVDQQGEGWIWTCDDADGLVQNLRVGWRWE
jgi:hypothetical protein